MMSITVKYVLLLMIARLASGADATLIDEKPSSPESQPRATRATDKYLSLEIERMQNVARLITGISIQLGLISGKITPEKVISELLHLGNFTHTQIISIDATKVKKAIEDMKLLPNKLKSDVVSGRVEEKLKLMDEVRGLIQGIDVEKWEKRKEFEEEMENLKNKGLDLSSITTIVDEVKDWNSQLRTIRKMKFDASNPKAVSDATFSTGKLNEFSTDLLTMIGNFSANQTKSWTYQKIDNITEALKPIINGVGAVKKVHTNEMKIPPLSQDTQDFTVYTANLQSLSEASNSVAEVLASFQIVRSVVLGRTRPGAPLEFPGFPEGFRDINRIFVGLVDSWMRAIVDSDSMTSSLKPLNSLASMFQQVDNALGSAKNEHVAMIQDFLDLAAEIKGVSMNPTETEIIMKSYRNCSRLFSPDRSPDVTSTANLLSNATNLETKVIEIRDMVHKFMGHLDTDKARKSLEKVRDLTAAFNDTSKLPNIVSELQTSEEIKELNLVLADAEAISFIQVGKDMPNIKRLAGVVSKEIASVDSFQNSLSTQPTFFKCLQEIDNVKALETADAVRMTQKFRGIQPKVITEGEMVVKKVINAARDFQALEGAIDSMNNQSTVDSKALKELPDPEKHSGTIGAATWGIRAMKRAIEERAQADVIVKNSDVVEGLLSTITLDQKDKDLLDAVAKLNKSIGPMYLKLEAWKEGIKETDSTVLASHSALFTSAKMVPGVDGNLREMSESVGRLKNLVSDPMVKRKLDSVKEALEALDAIGLDFSAYKTPFDESGASLAALDLTFAKAKAKASSSKTPPVNAPVAPQQNPMTSGVSPPTKIDTGSPSLLWIIGLLVVFVVCIIIVVIVVMYVMMLKKKKFKEEELQEKTAREGPKSESGETQKKSVTVITIRELDEQPTQRDDTVQVVDCSRTAYINFAEDLKRRIKEEERLIIENTKEILCAPKEKNKLKRQLETINRTAGMRKLCLDILTVTNDIPCDDHIILSEKDSNGKKVYVSKKTLFKLEGYGDRFKDNFINANLVVFQSNLRYILTKSPVLDGPGETVRKFYWMVKQSMCEFIINLCGWSSDPAFVKYFPSEGDKEMQFGGLTVRCTSRVDEHDLITRKLAIKFSGDETEHFVTHFQFDRWEEDLPPGTPGCAIIVKLMRTVRSSQRPVIVHCSDGVNRSGVVAFAEASYQSLCYKDVIPYTAVLLSLREQRARVITGAIQMAFCLALIAEYCAVTCEAGVSQSQRCKAKQFVTIAYEEYHWTECDELAEKQRDKVEKAKKERQKESAKNPDPK